MKKREKYQNRQIFSNQSIHIKYYLNFLTFFFISSFRLKYYYNYINYAKIFNSFFKILGFSIRSGYLLKTAMLPNFLYFKLFKNYMSYNLNKFAINKNIYTEHNSRYFLSAKNKNQEYAGANIPLFGRSVTIFNDLPVNEKNVLSIINDNLIINNNKILFNYYIYLEFLSILSSLLVNNQLNLYKLYIYIIYNKI